MPKEARIALWACSLCARENPFHIALGMSRGLNPTLVADSEPKGHGTSKGSFPRGSESEPMVSGGLGGASVGGGKGGNVFAGGSGR